MEQTVSAVQSFQEFGGLAGRFLLAFLAVAHRQPAAAAARLSDSGPDPGADRVRRSSPTSSLTLLKWGIFLLGITTIAQFSFWGNYLPRVYPTYLRGTGESFAANVGGRMIGTCGRAADDAAGERACRAPPRRRSSRTRRRVGTAAWIALASLGTSGLPSWCG